MNIKTQELLEELCNESKQAVKLICRFRKLTTICLGIYHVTDSSFSNDCSLCGECQESHINHIEWNYHHDRDPDDKYKTLSEKLVAHMLLTISSNEPEPKVEKKVEKKKVYRKSDSDDEPDLCEDCGTTIDGQGIFTKCHRCYQKLKKDKCPGCGNKFNKNGKNGIIYKMCYTCNSKK